jgi:hypothetical protein
MATYPRPAAAAAEASFALVMDTTPRTRDSAPARPAPRGSSTRVPIAPGRYQCQISEEYRFRACTVSRGADGQTYIDMPGGLLHLRGTLRGDGRDLLLDAAAQGDHPFGCGHCADGRVSEIGEIHPRTRCIPPARKGVEECRSQRAVARLRYAAGRWRGSFVWTSYLNKYEYLPDETNRVIAFTTYTQRLSVTIRR